MMKWIDVKDDLPENNKNVLATYTNSYGKQRTIIAAYIRAKTLNASDFYDCDCDELGDYSEEDDTYYVTPGWYEQLDNWDYASVSVYQSNVVTHWMPLPETPEKVTKG